MKKTPQTDLETWLRAETSGAADEADQALVDLMRLLPLVSPSRGFAGRVLARARVATSLPVDAFARRSMRWAIALGLILAASTLLVTPSLLQPLVSSFSLAGLLGGMTQLLVLMGRWIGGGAAFWRVASEVGAAVSLAISKPPVAGLLLAMVATSALALRVLNRLMSPERSAAHA